MSIEGLSLEREREAGPVTDVRYESIQLRYSAGANYNMFDSQDSNTRPLYIFAAFHSQHHGKNNKDNN